MRLNTFHKAATYIREVHEMALYAAMSDSGLYAAFGASPLMYIILPFLGLLLTFNALFNGYKLFKAQNKNIESWLAFLTSAVCAVLASISLYGAALSALVGFSFAAGPWFFFSSLMLASLQQIFMVGLNLLRAYECLPESAQRMHYVQAAMNNLFILSLLSAAIGSVLFIMLFPTVAPVVGSICAGTAVVLTFIDITWRTWPESWKIAVKDALNFTMPAIEANDESEQLKDEEDLESEPDEDNNPKHSRLFTCVSHRTEVFKLGVAHAKEYLIKITEQKLKSYDGMNDLKSQHKVAVLTALQKVLNDSSNMSNKKQTLVDYPLAFQSFRREKGEVEEIFDAVFLFQNMSKEPESQYKLG